MVSLEVINHNLSTAKELYGEEVHKLEKMIADDNCTYKEIASQQEAVAEAFQLFKKAQMAKASSKKVVKKTQTTEEKAKAGKEFYKSLPLGTLFYAIISNKVTLVKKVESKGELTAGCEVLTGWEKTPRRNPKFYNVLLDDSPMITKRMRAVLKR